MNIIDIIDLIAITVHVIFDDVEKIIDDVIDVCENVIDDVIKVWFNITAKNDIFKNSFEDDDDETNVLWF